MHGSWSVIISCLQPLGKISTNYHCIWHVLIQIFVSPVCFLSFLYFTNVEIISKWKFFLKMRTLFSKSCRLETPIISTDADSSTAIFVSAGIKKRGWYRTQTPIPNLAIPGSFMQFPGSLHPLLSWRENSTMKRILLLWIYPSSHTRGRYLATEWEECWQRVDMSHLVRQALKKYSYNVCYKNYMF